MPRSLGLILLELLSSFGSAHERAITFANCRKGSLPQLLSSPALKDIGDLILSCTSGNPESRPTIDDILQCELFGNLSDIQAATIRRLELQVEEKEEENRRLRLLVEQQAEMLSMRNCAENSETACTGHSSSIGEDY